MLCSLSQVMCLFGSYLPSVVVFTSCVFVCAQWCPTHSVLCFCFVFLRLVYPTYMLPVPLDCLFVIVPSVFFNVQLIYQLIQMLVVFVDLFVVIVNLDTFLRDLVQIEVVLDVIRTCNVYKCIFSLCSMYFVTHVGIFR